VKQYGLKLEKEDDTGAVVHEESKDDGEFLIIKTSQSFIGMV
jgi:hypothetical protein